MTVVSTSSSRAASGVVPNRRAAWLRTVAWRFAWWLCGGLRVTGRAPHGPAVIVANHRSHADSAALLAALPAGTEVVFAAAADYWCGSATRRAVTKALIPTLPVPREGGGAYLTLRAAARPVLRRGGVVVVYPEGTRCGAASLGAFKAGALHLARDLAVPLVAAAVDGTQHVLPKGGRFRPAGVGVRFGAALTGRDLASCTTDDLRARVTGLLRVTKRPDPSRIWTVLAHWLGKPWAPLLTLLWGFAEALSWPVIAELALVVFAVAVPATLWRHTVGLVAGSVAGIVVHAWLVGQGVHLPMPMTTPGMQAEAATNLASGAWGLMAQAFSGVPVKVYAAQAGSDGLGLASLAGVAVLERGLRAFAVAAILGWLARWVLPLVRRYYGWYLLTVACLFIAAETRIVAYWG